ncbi:hypothetical protein KY359_05875 [Candidatus Woesearchaeota archaeon]|nr:hypothetical protein [Candidatus Woesearchaeota archaeon]
MKLAHNMTLSVFSYESDGEDTEQIAAALASLCPFDLEQEKLSVKRTSATGFQERKIIILELTLTKERHTTKFLEHLKSSLSQSNRSLLLRQAESRLDNELNFFIRLDKPKLLADNRFWLTDSGDCFHIKISVAAYPANRDAGLKVIREWLEQ